METGLLSTASYGRCAGYVFEEGMFEATGQQDTYQRTGISETRNGECLMWRENDIR